MSSLETTYAPLVAAPAVRRDFGARDAFGLWFSLGVGLLVLQAGALLVPALSLGQALAAILVGTIVGVLPLAAAGVIGSDSGLAAMATLRPSFGLRGAGLPAALNVLQLVGWGSFEIIIMADAANALTKDAFGVASPVLWTLAFGALATALAIAGPLFFVRKFLRAWGLPLILAASAWLTWALLARGGLGAAFQRPAAGGLGFMSAVDIVAAMPLSWLPVIADHTRFGRSPRAMFTGSALGYLIANVWFFALGAAYALTSGAEASLPATLALAGGGLALFLILLDETDNAFAAIHSAAVSGATLAPLSPEKLALGFGAFCTLVALTVPLAQYEGFLILIGSVFAPLFGVVLADHFLIRRRRIDAAAIDAKGGAYWFTAGFRIPGLAAWALGVAVYQGVTAWASDIGATIPSMAVAAAAFWIAARREER